MKSSLRAMLAAAVASALMAPGAASALPLANPRAAPSPDARIVMAKMMRHKHMKRHDHARHHGMMHGRDHMLQHKPM